MSPGTFRPEEGGYLGAEGGGHLRGGTLGAREGGILNLAKIFSARCARGDITLVRFRFQLCCRTHWTGRTVVIISVIIDFFSTVAQAFQFPLDWTRVVGPEH